MRISRAVFMLITWLISHQVMANLDSDIKKSVNEKNIPYLHCDTVRLKCNMSGLFDLVIKRYDNFQAIELSSAVKTCELENITFVFEDDKQVQIESNCVLPALVCYFGGIWERQTLWSWLGQKSMKALIVNEETRIELRDCDLIKSIVNRIEEHEL